MKISMEIVNLVRRGWCKHASGAPTPLIIAPHEGERLIRKWGYPLTIKVDGDADNGGSQRFCAGTEDIPPGKAIPVHRHLHADELVIILGGVALATLGSTRRDIGAGYIVYSPCGEWMGFKNIGAEPLRIFWIFSSTGFEDYVRATSVGVGTPFAPPSREELARIRKKFKRVIELRDEHLPDYTDPEPPASTESGPHPSTTSKTEAI